VVELHWTQKCDQGVHEDYPIQNYDERYEIVAIPIKIQIDSQILT